MTETDGQIEKQCDRQTDKKELSIEIHCLVCSSMSQVNINNTMPYNNRCYFLATLEILGQDKK